MLVDQPGCVVLSEMKRVVAADKADSRSALLMVNGDCNESALARCRQVQPDLLIAVDGGLRHCMALDSKPDLLIGDLDSASDADIARLGGAGQVIRYQAEKDQTDLELALEYAQAQGVGHITLAGLSGGRTDQMLCNWLLLGQSRWHFSIDVVDDSGCGYLVVAGKGRRIAVEPDAIISLLALTDTVVGVTCGGLMYGLSDADLPLGSSLGISNVASDRQFTVNIRQGVLLAYVNAAVI